MSAQAPKPPRDDAKTRRIVCAAIRYRDSGTVVCGVHHGACISTALRFRLPGDSTTFDCGFVDTRQKFLTRREAWRVADAAGQILRPTGWEQDYSQARPAGVGDDGLLFSENLYYW